MTVGQALWDLCEWLPLTDRRSLCQGYRDFVVTTILGGNLPNADVAMVPPLADIQNIYARVPSLHNDHAIKVTYSAHPPQ